MRQLSAGLAGVGRFGKLHAAVLASLPGVRLEAICDPVEANLNAIGQRYGIAHCFTSYHDMLENVYLDCVFIVTTEPLHAQMALQALERGIAVFVEKPLATSYSDGRIVAEAAIQAKLPLQVGMILRFDVQHAYIKQQIAAGRFGHLVSLRAKRNYSRSWFPAYGDRVHPVFEANIHDIDLCIWYTASPCKRVYALQRTLSNSRYPDACFAILEFANGCIAILETSWFVPAGAPANVLTEDWRGTIDAALEIVGTEQVAHPSLLNSGLSFWSPVGAIYPETVYWPELHGRVVGALLAEIEHFLDCVRSRSFSPIIPVEEAVEGLRIAEAIVTSAETGREVVL